MKIENAETIHLRESTLAERNRMLAGGMKEITIEELIKAVCDLGYYINSDDSFNYVNSGNQITYKARSIAIRHSISDECFSNIYSPKDKLPELQKIRRNCFVFSNGHIWEL